MLANPPFRVLEQPLKIPFLAGVVQATNQQKPDLGREILEKSAAQTQGLINAGDWREVKLLLRFLGSLQGMLEGHGVFPIFEELFARAVDLQTASSEDVSLCDASTEGLANQPPRRASAWSLSKSFS